MSPISHLKSYIVINDHGYDGNAIIDLADKGIADKGRRILD